MSNAPEPTVEQIGRLRWLVQQADAAVSNLVQKESKGHLVMDVVFLAFFVGMRLLMHDFLIGRVVASAIIAVIAVSLLSNLYHHTIGEMLVRRRRAAA